MRKKFIAAISIAVVLTLLIISSIYVYNVVIKRPKKSFSIILLPDTQYYSQHDKWTYFAQTQWIVDYEDEYNIKFVIHLGDITNNNTSKEWVRAWVAHTILDVAGIPFSVLPGNHDNPNGGHGGHDTYLYNFFFLFLRAPFIVFHNNFVGSHEGYDNTAFAEEWEGLKFLIVNLEWAPLDDALEWADSLIQEFPDHRVIIATHCYLDQEGAYQMNCCSKYGVDGNNGQEIWEKLVRKHSNVFLVVSGHINGSVIVGDSVGINGNRIYQILTDFQNERNRSDNYGRDDDKHGNGWLRILTFRPEQNEIESVCLSVLGIQNLTETDNNGSDYVNTGVEMLEYNMTESQ